MKYIEKLRNTSSLFTVLSLIILGFILVHSLRSSFTHLNVWNIYMVAIDNFWSHNNVYSLDPRASDLFKYSPFFLILITPFSLIPPTFGKILWQLLNATLLVAVPIILSKWLYPNYLKKKQVHWIALLTIITCLELINLNVITGQSNILILYLLVLGLHLYLHKKPKLATGLIFAIAGVIKIFPFLFSIYFILKRELKISLYILFFGICLLFLPGLFIGLEHNWLLLNEWFQILHKDANHPPMKISLWALMNSYLGIESVPLKGKDMINLPWFTKSELKTMWASIVILYGFWLAWVLNRNHNKRKNNDGYALLIELSAISMGALIFSHMTEGPTRILVMPVYLLLLTNYQNRVLLFSFVSILAFQSIGSDLGEFIRYIFYWGHWNWALILTALLVIYLDFKRIRPPINQR